MLSPKLSLALALAALFFFTEAPMRCSGAEPVKIGPLYQCDHDVRGTVYAIHEKEIMIVGFEYDAKGPSTWFHGMLRDAKAISTAVAGEYVQIASPDGTCDRLAKDKTYNNANVTLKLPKPIKEFETIGVYCFEFCNNFGHIYISKELTGIPPAPADFEAPKECTNTYPACSVEKSKHNAIHADCPAGTAREEKNTAMIPHVDKMLVGLSMACLLKANK